jgi:diacylglycerol kinase (ATP)
MAQFLAMGLVLVAESLNTAIEKISDFIHPDYNEKIGIIKDVSAGAAFFSAVIALVIGMLIYLPKIYALF